MHEIELLNKKLLNWPQPIVGVDEVGRGCLAGPVCAGAVILSKKNKFLYKDSKSLTPKKRKILAQKICKENKTGIGWASVLEIDQINILQASLLAMKRAVFSLNISKGSLLIDGQHTIFNLNNFSQMSIIKGDSSINSISAASIIAKYFRDEKLKSLAQIYPQYGFEKHKGYPTLSHKMAIKKWRPCPIHRKSFSGVKEILCPLSIR